MLKEYKGAKDEDNQKLKTEVKALRERLIAQQQLVRETKLPIIVLLEGWAAAGKGSMISALISEIDPRFYNVVSPVVLPEREERCALAKKEPEADAQALALMTKDGLAGMAFAVTGARALRSACRAGAAVHLIGGIAGLLMMLALAVVGAAELLTPANVLLYQLIWMVPGLLITEWTRSV